MLSKTAVPASAGSIFLNKKWLKKWRLLGQVSYPIVSYYKFLVYSTSGCVGRGLDLDLRVCPSPPSSAASGNFEFSHFRIELEKEGFGTA